MNDKTSFNLLSAMFFNINFFRVNIPKLLIGGRSLYSILVMIMNQILLSKLATII